MQTRSQRRAGRCIAPEAADNDDGKNQASFQKGAAGDSAAEPPGALPHELLVKVLALVPQKFRLSSAALVCRAWRDAAAAATGQVQLGFGASTAKGDSLMRWLPSEQGQHVTSLFLTRLGTPSAPLQVGSLPRANQLRQLTLSRCHLQLTAPEAVAGHQEGHGPSGRRRGRSAAGSSAPPRVDNAGALSSLSSLTQLVLGYSCGSTSSGLGAQAANTFVGAPECFTALAQLTSLQHLHVSATSRTPIEKVLFGARPKFPAGVLSHLVRLTHLDLNQFTVTAAALENLTRLSALQHLDFGEYEEDQAFHDDDYEEGGPVPAAALAAVSGLQHLTSLQVPGAMCVVGSTSTPGLSTLTALRNLSLRYGEGLQPSVLAHFTSLQVLSLWCAQLQPAPASGPQGGGSSTAELLRVLPGLQQLTKLCLYTALHDTATAAQYSALVASSRLEELLLTGSELPQAAWQAMFDGRRQVPALKSLTMNAWTDNSLGGCKLSTQDLRSLALSCPSLQDLCLRGSVDPAADWAVLQPLQRMGHLIVDQISDNAAASLATLTCLKQLSIMEPSSISAEGMAHFVAMRQLEGLDVDECRPNSTGPGFVFLNHRFMDDAPRGSPPDVWQQLQEYLRQPAASRNGYVSQGFLKFERLMATISQS